MTEQKPTIGRIVHYQLSEQDVEAITQCRDDARTHPPEHGGNQMHVGNYVRPGDTYPMIITRVWGDSPDAAVNGQVALDGNDVLWVTSVQVGEGPRHFKWPTRV